MKANLKSILMLLVVLAVIIAAVSIFSTALKDKNGRVDSSPAWLFCDTHFRDELSHTDIVIFACGVVAV